MGAWNGAALVTEFSATLGDTSTSFKARVVGWLNDIQDDICSRHQWPFLHKLGKKLLTSSEEFQLLNVSAPTAPTIVTQNGGSLTDAATYSVKLTYYCSSNDYETEGGTASSTVTCNTPNLQISLTAIPVSQEAIVTSRKIYLSKNGGSYYYVSSISDNTTTTATISADATSTVEPKDYIGIKTLIGSPWIESNGAYLDYRNEDDIRFMFPKIFGTGVPQYFCSIDYNKILTYPMASTGIQLKYNYIKVANRIFNEATVQPDLPIWMKNILEAGVLWKGYQYRERAHAVTYMQRYEQLLSEAISDRSKSRQGAARVRDVRGTSDGYVF
jgi:hypothetical protein